MKDDAGDVVIMPPAGVHFPGLGFVHAPELDHAVVGAGNDQRQRRVEGSPIDAAIVTLEHKEESSFLDSAHYGPEKPRIQT